MIARETFLREQHRLIMESGKFVAVEWRDSVDRFIADLWDGTPNKRSSRFLGMRDKKLGYSRDNVEWHFHKSTRPMVKASKTAKVKVEKPRAPTYADKRAEALRAKAERRQKLAEEFAQWERQRSA